MRIRESTDSKKGTQGREMTRTIRITSSGILIAALCAAAPAAAPAASTLLSGYGGPGAGEQAIIGATLLNVPSSGSPGSGGVAGGGGSSSSGATPGGSTQGTGTGADTGGSTPGGSATGGSAGTSGAGGPSSGGTAGARSFEYPNALRAASADSPLLGLSAGGLAVLLAVVAGLVALGAVTIRLARLQR
jgi:hypothetical protein